MTLHRLNEVVELDDPAVDTVVDSVMTSVPGELGDSVD